MHSVFGAYAAKAADGTFFELVNWNSSSFVGFMKVCISIPIIHSNILGHKSIGILIFTV